MEEITIKSDLLSETFGKEEADQQIISASLGKSDIVLNEYNKFKESCLFQEKNTREELKKRIVYIAEYKTELEILRKIRQTITSLLEKEKSTNEQDVGEINVDRRSMEYFLSDDFLKEYCDPQKINRKVLEYILEEVNKRLLDCEENIKNTIKAIKFKRFKVLVQSIFFSSVCDLIEEFKSVPSLQEGDVK